MSKLWAGRGRDVLSALQHLLPLMDAACVILAAAIVTLVTNEIRQEVHIDLLDSRYRTVVILAATLTPFVFSSYGLYDSQRGKAFTIELVHLVAGWVTVVVVLLVLSAATKTTAWYSRVWATSWVLAAATILVALRLAGRAVVARIRSRGRDIRRVLLLGGGELAQHAIHGLASEPAAGFRIIGFVTEKNEAQKGINDVACLGTLSHMDVVLKQLPSLPDELWIAIPVVQGRDLARATKKAVNSHISTRVILDVTAHSLLSYPLGLVAGLTYADLNPTPMRGLNRLLKALEDRVLSALGLLLVLPLMMVIAIGVRLSSQGPVLFRQKRHGLDGLEIMVWKFRTMYVHHEPSGHVTQARRDDPRITPLGRLLRRTSLDELPQLFNVLGGSMSLVGPRPHAVEHDTQYQQLVPGYLLRHRVKPGITGWAQVNGLRGETETLELIRQRIEYDLYYIRNWSVWFDLAILLLTPFKGVVSSRAY